MKTNLAYIGSTALTVLDQSPQETIIRHVAGFPIATTPAPDSAWDRQKRSYAEDAAEVTKRLKARDVTPIAVMPTAWWEKIVEESGLWALAPNDSGEIKIDPGVATRDADGPLTLFAWILTAGSILGTAAWATMFSGNWIGLPILAALACLPVALLTILFAVTFEDTFKALTARWASRFYVLTHGEQATMAKMIASKDYSGKTIKISLPMPPQDVSETLAKVASLPNLRVAAEPGAVSFSKSASEIIRQDLADEWKKEKEARERARALDPIIYVEQGSAIAIIAQFGDFPIEKAVVDRVLKTQRSIV